MQLYQIHYPKSNVTQVKVLISHDEYLKAKAIIDDDEYKQALKQLSGGREWFTDKSLIYKAITTGFYKLGRYTYPCIVTKIDNPQ